MCDVSNSFLIFSLTVVATNRRKWMEA